MFQVLNLFVSCFDKSFYGLFLALQDFTKGLHSLKVLTSFPLTDSQIHDLFQLLDKDSSGFVNYREFCEAFAVIDTHQSSSISSTSTNSLKKLKTDTLKTSSNVTSSFPQYSKEEIK